MRPFFIGLALFIVEISAAKACTIFASHGGSLPFAGKLRDAQGDHDQEIQWVAPRRTGEKYSYLGVFAVRGADYITFSPLKMGVNEKGVFIGFATPSATPATLRWQLPFFKDLTHHLLTRAGTAEQALEILKTMDHELALGLRILMVADGHSSFLFENGAYQNNSFTATQENWLVGTNHFSSPGLRHLNLSSTANSSYRRTLALNTLPALVFASRTEIEKALLKLWVKKSDHDVSYTRSDFIVFYPPGQSPIVKIRIEKDGKIEALEYSLKNLFPKPSPSCERTLSQTFS